MHTDALLASFAALLGLLAFVYITNQALHIERCRSFVLLCAMMLWLCKTEPHVTVLLHVICLMWKVHFTLTCQIKVIRNLLSAMQDVYTDSGIGLTRGNAFPASEVRKVSQDSRHLWLQQRPFRLKRSMSTSLRKYMGQVCVIVYVALLGGLICCSCYS